MDGWWVSCRGCGVNEGEGGVWRDRSLVDGEERQGGVALRLDALLVGDVGCC